MNHKRWDSEKNIATSPPKTPTKSERQHFCNANSRETTANEKSSLRGACVKETLRRAKALTEDKAATRWSAQADEVCYKDETSPLFEHVFRIPSNVPASQDNEVDEKNREAASVRRIPIRTLQKDTAPRSIRRSNSSGSFAECAESTRKTTRSPGRGRMSEREQPRKSNAPAKRLLLVKQASEAGASLVKEERIGIIRSKSRSRISRSKSRPRLSAQPHSDVCASAQENLRVGRVTERRKSERAIRRRSKSERRRRPDSEILKCEMSRNKSYPEETRARTGDNSVELDSRSSSYTRPSSTKTSCRDLSNQGRSRSKGRAVSSFRAQTPTRDRSTKSMRSKSPDADGRGGVKSMIRLLDKRSRSSRSKLGSGSSRIPSDNRW